MSVHYKFKSALDFDTITFDGLHISVSDLKKSITYQKRLGKTADFDLQITNAQTKEEYCDDSSLIPKNTSLIIARIPLAVQPKKPWDPSADKVQFMRNSADVDSSNVDLSRMNGSEEDKIQAMMIQSTIDYDPNNYQKIRGSNQTGDVPLNYRCYKCHKPGHWIKNCPIGDNTDVKRNTGIPRSFIDRGREMQNESSAQPLLLPDKKQEVPEDLICGICKDLFNDAVMIPCCGSSFCDECVRTALLESDDNECPDCKEKGTSPGSLIPNRFLRNNVNSFKNETGYSKHHSNPICLKLPKPTILQELVENEVPFQDTDVDISHVGNVKIECDNTRESTPNSPVTHQKDIDSKSPVKKTDSLDILQSETSHDDSDFEDNITVTVPPANFLVQAQFRDRHINGRNVRPTVSHDLEHPQKSHRQFLNFHQEGVCGKSNVDEKCSYPSDTINNKRNIFERDHHQPSHSIHTDHNFSGGHISDSNSKSYGNYLENSDLKCYNDAIGQIMPNLLPERIYDHQGVSRTPFSGAGMTGFVAPLLMPMRALRPKGVTQDPTPLHSLAEVYQGVQAQVGSGIIDDPLEAFNRIMREKERRRGEERRRNSPDLRRRSRSIELDRRHSPADRRRSSRTRSPDGRRLRSPIERRLRSRDRRSEDRERRRRRSSSYSSRGSRSYSRSHTRSPRRRSRTPIRKRSRSPVRRSRSRSKSLNLSRNRFRENRRLDRIHPRDEFHRDFRNELIDQSPNSRNCVRLPQNYRQSTRLSLSQQESFFNGPVNDTIGECFSSEPFRSNNRFGGGNVMNRQILPTQFSTSQMNEPSPDMRFLDGYSSGRYDDVPPGTEPPPPGYENMTPDFFNHNSNLRELSGNGANHKRNYFDSYRQSREDSPNATNEAFEIFRHSSAENRDRMPLHVSTSTNDRKRNERRSQSHSQNTRLQTSSPHDRRRRSKSRTPNYRDQRKDSDNVRERYDRDHVRDYDKEKRDNDKAIRRDQSDRERERDRKFYDVKDRREDRERKEIRDKEKVEREKEKDKDKEREREQEREKEKENVRDREKENVKTHDSSEEERKDKKSKEKKKKKKEKDAEKKRKKDRKEREKREKDSKKDIERAEQFLGNTNGEAVVASDILPSLHDPCGELFPTATEIEASLTPPKDTVVLNSITNQFLTTDLPTATDDAIPEDIPAILNEYTIAQNVSPSLNVSDNVLEIHANCDFEHDLEEGELESDNKKKVDGGFVPIPEPSKWEREEDGIGEKKVTQLHSPINDERLSGKVTSEVLKRAENAIFARAINAIRSIEIKKISVERQKLYSNEKLKDALPGTSAVVEHVNPAHEIKSFQITVPCNSDSERSVAIKTEINSEKIRVKNSPIRSVKDRLGCRVDETNITTIRQSRSPIRKIAAKDESQRRDSPCKNRSQNDFKDCSGRKHESDTKNKIKVDNNKVELDLQFNREKEKGREKEKKIEIGKEASGNFDREKDRGVEKEKERERFHEKELDRKRDIEKSKERLDNKQKERFQRERNRQQNRFRHRSRERFYDKDRNKFSVRPRKFLHENSGINERSNDIDKTKVIANKAYEIRERKRDRSGSHSLQGRNKREKKSKVDDKRQRSDDKVENKSYISVKKKDKCENLESSMKTGHVTTDSSLKTLTVLQCNKILSKESENKRSHSMSSGTSSDTLSNTSGTSSGSESKDRKKKNKKHKKKKAKHMSSSDTEEGGCGGKKKKSKKKSKSKKKKKSKK